MEKMTKENLLDFNFLTNLKVSPNEARAAFTLARANGEENTYHHTLYTYEDGDVKKHRKLHENSGFIFLDDTTLLLDLQKNKEEKEALREASRKSIYRYDLEKKSLEEAFTLPLPATLEEVVDANTLLISAFLTEADHVLYEDESKREEHLKQKKKDSAYEDIDDLPYYFNGMGFKTGKHKQLFLYDTEAGTLKRLLDKKFSVGNFTLSDDKRRIYYTGSQDEKVMTFYTKVYQLDLETFTRSVLYDKLDYSVNGLFEIQGRLIATAKAMQDYGLNENPDFYTVENGEMKLLSTFGKSLGNTIGTDVRLSGSRSWFVSDDTLYFVSTVDDHSEIMTLSLEGKVQTEYALDGSIDGILKLKNEAVMIAMEGTNLQELYTYDFATRTIRKQSGFNRLVLKNTYVAQPQEVVVKKETHEVKGFVLLPKDYDANKKYPAILNIHGGPKTVYGPIFYHEMQYWASEGYIVMFANPRGSDGKGNDFADIRGKYGTIDYEDLMDFTDKVLETYPAVDQGRMFVTGGSYGGFMTNWIVGQTDRFKAAATQRSISNWLSFYGTSDIGYFFASDQTDGHPLKDLEKLFNQSPIKYALDMKTPLLFIHSDKDYRCPMEQAQQLYAILKHNGVDTKLVWFKDETHELSRSGKPEARLKRLADITGWFDRYRS
ncbi:MAG: prolyl oligopeptidase family serine peptidase [Bacillota bacterium]